jgi:hypothetical protein
LRDGSGCIQSPILQSLIQTIAMLLRSDNHGRLSSSQRVTDKTAQFVEKEAIFSVELDDVSCVLMVGPLRPWRR